MTIRLIKIFIEVYKVQNITNRITSYNVCYTKLLRDQQPILVALSALLYAEYPSV